MAAGEARRPPGWRANFQGPELTHVSEKLDPSAERADGTAFVAPLLVTIVIC